MSKTISTVLISFLLFFAVSTPVQAISVTVDLQTENIIIKSGTYNEMITDLESTPWWQQGENIISAWAEAYMEAMMDDDDSLGDGYGSPLFGYEDELITENGVTHHHVFYNYYELDDTEIKLVTAGEYKGSDGGFGRGWAVVGSPVPEPATMLLFGLGLLGLAGVNRRKTA